MVVVATRSLEGRREAVRTLVAVTATWLAVAGCAREEQTDPMGGAGTGGGGIAGTSVGGGGGGAVGGGGSSGSGNGGSGGSAGSGSGAGGASGSAGTAGTGAGASGASGTGGAEGKGGSDAGGDGGLAGAGEAGGSGAGGTAGAPSDPYGTCDGTIPGIDHPDCEDAGSTCQFTTCVPPCSVTGGGPADCPLPVAGSATPDCRFQLCYLVCDEQALCPAGMNCAAGVCRWTN